MFGLGVDHCAYRVRPRQAVVQDLHGPFSIGEACWPAPYRHPIDSPAQKRALVAPVNANPVAMWWHGQLTHVTTEGVLEQLQARWGRRRTEGALVGPFDCPAIPETDRRLIASFCQRGWLRLLVRAFEHVGCKAEHYGVCSGAALAVYGDLGEAVLQSRGRHRLAVLEELLEKRGGDSKALFGAFDVMDQSMDKLAGRKSWTMACVPEHVRSLWPMRNLMRGADRMGVCFEAKRWQAYEEANSYAPELHILAMEPEIYGAGTEHDITHYLETVFWSPDRIPFEVGNNGSEGDGQAMNNLILACHYTGPGYEGNAGWPAEQLFEWLERAFQVASIPQMFCVLRTFTIVLHREFEGDPRAVLKELVPSTIDGTHLDDLMKYFRGYVQHDHDFLGRMHARYLTPVYAEWRAIFGELLTNSLEEHVAACDSVLWMLEDIDLVTFDYEVIGRLTNSREINRISGKKLVELVHLLVLAKEEGAEHLSEGRRLLERVVATEKSFDEPVQRAIALSEQCLVDGVADELRDLDGLYGALDAAVKKYETALGDLVARVQQSQKSWSDPIVELKDNFLKPDSELFRGYYYDPALHTGSDVLPGVKRLGEYESVA